jgi:hypothetical protein
MKIYYDFHIHSCLSPCADDEMTPLNIVMVASIKGLDVVAVADHNAIFNVAPAMELGEVLGVTVIPAVEVQTNEDIHILALFETHGELVSFFNKLEFADIKNKKEIYGNQFICNSDGETIGEEERLLLASCTLGVYELCPLIKQSGGVAIAAHIDREANGLVSILGFVPEDLDICALEFTNYATAEFKNRFLSHKQVTCSDAHTLEQMSDKVNFLQAENNLVKNVIKALKQ